MRCLLIILSFLPMISPAQDSLRIMYYNLLNYPDTSPERADTLRKIVHYAKPDIFVINELQTEAGADLILSQSMNQLGVLSYQRVAFIDGNDTDNMLYYNSDKLGFISQTQVNTTLRDFSEYILYYKSPGLSASSDTVYLNKSDGTLMDMFVYPALTSDYSYGRYPNGSGTFSIFTYPTPLANNDLSGTSELIIKPSGLTAFPTSWNAVKRVSVGLPVSTSTSTSAMFSA